MKPIDELKRLSTDRTPLRWIATNQHIMNGDCYPIAKCEYDYDAQFICAIANNLDALIEVAQAAERLLEGEPAVTKFENLKDALQKLRAGE